MLRRFVILIVLILIGCQSATSTATPASPTSTSFPIETPIPQATFAPTYTPTVPASTVELEGAELPQGFSLIKFADLYHPIAITFDTQGRMYVTSQDGNVYILYDGSSAIRPTSRSAPSFSKIARASFHNFIP